MLPLRKHNLQIGHSCEVDCVWVQPPGLTLSTLPQRYTRVDSQRYDYAAPSLDFKAVIVVEEGGLAVEYGDLWHQP